MTNQEHYDILIEQVRKEADNLIKHATPKEIAKLEFRNIDAANQNRCIYGQMTGNCYLERAQELIIACAERVYPTHGLGGISVKQLDKINGKPEYVDPSSRYSKYHSPIELFILINEENEEFAGNKELSKNTEILVKYLKGETDTFEPIRMK